jgi:hypothetical protein
MLSRPEVGLADGGQDARQHRAARRSRRRASAHLVVELGELRLEVAQSPRPRSGCGSALISRLKQPELGRVVRVVRAARGSSARRAPGGSAGRRGTAPARRRCGHAALEHGLPTMRSRARRSLSTAACSAPLLRPPALRRSACGAGGLHLCLSSSVVASSVELSAHSVHSVEVLGQHGTPRHPVVVPVRAPRVHVVGNALGAEHVGEPPGSSRRGSPTCLRPSRCACSACAAASRCARQRGTM